MSFSISILKCPLKTFKLPGQFERASQLKSASERIRSSSYSEAYGEKSYPYGSEDMASDHHFLLFNDRPIACFKSITMETCNFYGLQFPILCPINGDLFDKTTQIIKTAEMTKKNILYFGGFCFDRNEIKNNYIDKRICFDWLYFHIHKQIQTDKVDLSFFMGVLKAGLDQKYNSYMNAVNVSEEIIKYKGIGNVDVKIQHITECNEEIVSNPFFSAYFSSRSVIGEKLQIRHSPRVHEAVA
jgi:hypothetical protein